MPSSTENVANNRSDKETANKSLMTRALKTSERVPPPVASRRSARKSTKRGTKLYKTTIGPKKYTMLEVLPVNRDLEQAIEEIESKGSTSETSELEEPERNDEFPNDFDIEQKLFLDFDIHSDELSLSEEESESVKEPELETPLENELDFFEVLGEVPRVDEVSLDLTDDAIVEQPKTLIKAPVVQGDGGKFVDPITGGRISIHPTTDTIAKTISKEEIKSEETDTETEIEEEDEGQQSQIAKNDVLQEEEFEEPIEDFEIKRASEEVAEETFKLFLETVQQKETPTVAKSESVEAVLITDEENKNLVKKILAKIIDQSVAKAEYLDRDVILRNFLDKNKLIKELKSKYDLLELERRTSQFLNRKTVSYLKRKGAMGMIFADKDNSLSKYRTIYHNTLCDLDNWLAREEKSKVLYSTEILDLKHQFEDAKQKSSTEIDKLEQLIRGAFQRKNFEKLQTSVEKHLNDMSTTREEISKVRSRLLLQQHQHTSLKNQMKKLEDLGTGFTVQHFESVETETFAMSKKIEEHNSALKRLHDQCNDDVHKLAHLKEKQKMMRNIITAQKHYYADLLQEKRDLREYITELKLERNRCRHEINNLGYRSGLLSKPELMKDYDQTVERTNELRQTNEDLRGTIQELSDKIVLLEKHCLL